MWSLHLLTQKTIAIFIIHNAMTHPKVEALKEKVTVSRAREKSRKSTEDEYLFLRWIFERATFEMAINIKREGLAEKNQEVVSIQKDLLAKLDKSWGS